MYRSVLSKKAKINCDVNTMTGYVFASFLIIFQQVSVYLPIFDRAVKFKSKL